MLCSQRWICPYIHFFFRKVNISKLLTIEIIKIIEWRLAQRATYGQFHKW
jgi:hypothetical protein